MAYEADYQTSHSLNTKHSMIEITAGIIGDKKVLGKLSALGGFFKSSRLRLLLEDTKNKLVSLARSNAPKKSRLLANTIIGRVEDFGSQDVKVRVASPVAYAPYVEFGTKPHVIRPLNKKVLFWYKYATGKQPLVSKSGKEASLVFTFRNEVWHPGAQAQPFFRPALHTLKPRFAKALLRVVREYIKEGSL